MEVQIFQPNHDKPNPEDVKQLHQKGCFSKKMGFLNEPTKQINSFKQNDLLPFLEKNGSELVAQIVKFPFLNLNYSNYDSEQLLILHTRMVIILNRILGYERRQGKTDNQISLPYLFTTQLYNISKVLGIKPSMVINLIGNWYPLNVTYLQQPQKFSFQDFHLFWFLTDDKEQQKLFFGASIIGAFHLARAIQACKQIHIAILLKAENVQNIIKGKFDVCISALNKIIQQVTIMYNKLDPNFFYKVLRPMLAGYKDLKFTGVLDNQGKQMILQHPGGTGGYDPSFQIFESALGIIFQQDYKNTQDSLYKEGIIKDHRQIIDWWRGWHNKQGENIRDFCKLCNTQIKKKYNQVLFKYKQFLNLHSIIIKKYILAFIPDQNHHEALGTGNTLITKITKRHEVIMKQMLQIL